MLFKCIHTGDRIAIISQGSLLCCGSFEYLKHRFGHGHRLTFVIKSCSDYSLSLPPRTFTTNAENEQVDHVTSHHSPAMDYECFTDDTEQKLTTFLQSLIIGTSLVERRGKEFHYLLPLLQARPRILSRLFAALEQQKDSLGIVSYGMTACSMEEVCILTMYVKYMY